ncbi:MAG: hypothetical protein J1E85_05390 [Ruminococcus sp.]|nr:hypothetical protein [Ruminococcus sp.]
MNDTQVTKGKIGRLIAKNLIVMLVAVIVALTGVLAWFTNQTSVEADGVSVECKAPDGVYIAIVKHGDPAPSDDEYSTEIHLNSENYPFLEDLYMTEVTGDGTNGSFLRPALTQSGGKAMVDTSAEWAYAEENSDFLSFDLYIRSESPHIIGLTSGSSIAPVSQKLTWNAGESTTGCNPSTYGNFSKDCIVGAVRFSVVANGEDETRELLWIPAPNIKLSDDAASVETNLTKGDTYKHFYYDENKIQKTLTNSAVVANNKLDYTLGSDKQIVEIQTTDADGDYFVTYVTCNMWVEGEDDESRLALVGGEYKVMLELMLMDN